MKKYTNKKKTAITIAFMGILGLCAVMGMSQKEYKSTYASVEPSTQAVIYDDESYSISLTFSETFEENITYSYLYTYLTTHETAFSYGSVNNTTNYASYISVNISFALNQYGQFFLLGENNTYNEVPYTFWYNSSSSMFFEDSLIFTPSESEYNALKTAIELDIQANQPEVSQGDTIITAITSGLGLAPDVANEFVKGFTTVFWDSTNNSLTRVSNFMLVMLGIAIVMAIIKLSLSLIRSNTGA